MSIRHRNGINYSFGKLGLSIFEVINPTAKPGILGGYHDIDGKGVFPLEFTNGEIRETEKRPICQEEFLHFLCII